VKQLSRLVVAGSAAACAVYTIVYLYRWEWHRAIVAAIFLVVAEVAIVATAVLRRLATLDQRLTDLVESTPSSIAGARRAQRAAAAPEPAADVLRRVRESAPPPRPVFAWLAPDRTGVFLPILLGAGVLASALAWVVEGLARATARPVLEHRLASRLGTLALPAGGLLGPAPAATDAAATGSPGTSLRSPRAGRVVVGVIAAAGLALGIDALADATQTRPQAARPGVGTVVELQLHGEVAGAAPERVLASLWHSCAGTLRRPASPAAVTDLGHARFRLEVPVDFGVHTARKVHGCLEDAALDRVQARVVSFRAVPAAAAAAPAPPGSSGP
jgi:hypothetical protein